MVVLVEAAVVAIALVAVVLMTVADVAADSEALSVPVLENVFEQPHLPYDGTHTNLYTANAQVT